jgi:hypothetical protein
MDTLTSSIGCDSVVLLDLQVNEISASSFTMEICQGDTFTFFDRDLTQGGVYVDTLVNAAGCDSIVSLTLVVHESYVTNLSYSVCQGDSIVIANKVYSSAGIHIDSLHSVRGCDSILVIDLEVKETRFGELNETICSDVSFDFHGTLLNTMGIYVDTLTSSIGCDSIVTLTLNVLPVKNTLLDIQICIGQTYHFNGVILDETGIYYDTLTSQNGCDSIVTLALREVETIEVDLLDTICENDFVMINEKVYDRAGDFTDTLVATGGCDSVIHINIFVAPIAHTNIQETICETEIFDFLGVDLNQAGIYFDTLVSVFGCDSIIELELIVLPTLHTALSESICEGDQFIVGDTAFDQTGQYAVNLVAVTGCDSIVSLDLTVIPTARHIDSIELCEGEAYTFNMVEYDSTGTYIDTLVSSAGCDSLAILKLLVHPNPFSTVLYNLCEGEVATIDGIDYAVDTTFQSIYTGIHGCDSTVTYDVTILPVIMISGEDVEICPDESVELLLTVTGTDSAVVEWFPATGLSCTDCLNPIASPMETTTYTVTTLGCGGVIVEASITVTVVPLPGMTVSEDETIDLGQTVSISATNEVATIPINWYNDDTGDLICMDCPQIAQRPNAPGEYHYRAVSVNGLGCGEEEIVTDSMTILKFAMMVSQMSHWWKSSTVGVRWFSRQVPRMNNGMGRLGASL